MEARVTRLEEAFIDVKATLRRLEDGQAKLIADIARLDGRVSQLPTTIQVFTYMLGLLGFTIALSAAVVGFARYLGRAPSSHAALQLARSVRAQGTR